MQKNLVEQYRKIIEKANIVSKTNINGIIIDVNEKFCEISGYTKEELIGKPHSIVRHSDMPKEIFIDLWNTIKIQKKIWKGIIKNKKKDGNPYWVQSFIFPILDKNGNILEFISVRTDITDLIILKDKLEQSLGILKELDQKKDDFLNIASHELRTPMTTIRGYLSMLIDGDIGEVDNDAKNYLKKIYNNVEGLLSLINDMLDISKIEAGKIGFFYEYFNLGEFLENFINYIKPLALEKNIEINVKIDYANIVLYSDKSKLSQLLNNIFSNAIKFSSNNGKIYFSSYIYDNKVYFKVKDNGIGISKKDLSKIFEKFGQVRNSLTRDIGGTGLGIPIVIGLLKEMKGDLEVKSSLNKGSEFLFYLPL